MIARNIYIGISSKEGKGVFTKTAIKAGKVIEVSPVLVLSPEERIHIEKTGLNNYIFEWGEDSRSAALGFGYLSIYNHEYQSNCEYFMDYAKGLMKIVTVRDIAEGEELFINYNGDFNDAKPLWFEAK